jgi:hypothetical protein
MVVAEVRTVRERVALIASFMMSLMAPVRISTVSRTRSKMTIVSLIE